jgi:gamma-glutamylcyclotransferase (GGCT)/AIG2-like uncharacterized protein YtfP
MISRGLCLFVYGTLRTDSRHAMATFLTGRATFLGRGTVPGRLYDLGPYPGLTAPQTPDERVRGEVHQLLDADATLAALDAYEGCSPPGGAPGLYERVLMGAALDSGEVVTVWTYRYCGPLDRARHLPSGEYPGSYEPEA